MFLIVPVLIMRHSDFVDRHADNVHDLLTSAVFLAHHKLTWIMTASNVFLLLAALLNGETMVA